MTERLSEDEAWDDWYSVNPLPDPESAFRAGWGYGWADAQTYFAEGGSFK